MIATVRIAPIQYWCKEGHSKPDNDPIYQRMAGMEVSIETNQIYSGAPCGGKGWLLTVESTAKIAALYDDGIERLPQVKFCEHMLEMD